MSLASVLQSVLGNKCPKCHHEKVFKNSNPYNLKDLYKMNETCNHCQLTYEREPGFFQGAMYVSYALNSGWLIVWYIVNEVWLHIEVFTFLFSLIGSYLVLSPLIVRWSRLIWLNFFNTFELEVEPEARK